MRLVQAQCPNCNASVEVNEDLEAAVCPYCGTAYIVERAIQNYSKTTINETRTTTNYGDVHRNSASTIVNNYYYSAPLQQTPGNPQQTPGNPQRMTGNSWRMAEMDTVRYSEKSKTTALILCIILGYFGVHRFYLGKMKSGILYLCTMGLGFYGWIFDIVWIALGKMKDGHNLPLR